ncbi:hypothetical protein Mgra_00008294 [Meloidogyne graminicola]|uniref:Transmembrane protein n=1 Tax=Meloidogyne graminicola TaxID=189291 RepID=A0A8S9ZG76_9BILA|nr:hypothetical protein Mgra_00008294 [Meloidogyne graminicola]
MKLKEYNTIAILSNKKFHFSSVAIYYLFTQKIAKNLFFLLIFLTVLPRKAINFVPLIFIFKNSIASKLQQNSITQTGSLVCLTSVI